jgi:hypothetical protein
LNFVRWVSNSQHALYTTASLAIRRGSFRFKDGDYGSHIPGELDVKPMPNWKLFKVAEPMVRVSLA